MTLKSGLDQRTYLLRNDEEVAHEDPNLGAVKAKSELQEGEVAQASIDCRAGAMSSNNIHPQSRSAV